MGVPANTGRATTTTVKATGATLRRVRGQKLRLADYQNIGPPEIIDEVFELAEKLKGLRVLQVNATAYGGGVAELLSSQIGLLIDAGIHARWEVISSDGDLFVVTKLLHNAMQGRDVEVSKQQRDTYLRQNADCAKAIKDEWDIIIVHDPQPAALIASNPAPSARWIWRCHIDTSTPNPDAWGLLEPFVAAYDATVFTLPAFVPPGILSRRAFMIPPAIDPLSTKNRHIPRHVSHAAIERAGVDLSRPLMVQVSRFDLWKDPLGVVQVWRLIREVVPDLQLALVGSMADDDPEGWHVHELVRANTRHEKDVYLLTDHTGIGALEVNAFQREADVVVQKSLREGFGLAVSEALWKETPVVGSNAGGIPLQIGQSEEGGAIVTTIEDCADAITTLLQNAELAAAKGHAGHERVANNFLMPRLVRDELALYLHLT